MAVTYESIASVTLTSNTQTVSFTSIPSTYTDLVLIPSPYLGSGTGSDLLVRFNNDTGSNYSRVSMYGTGTNASVASSSSSSQLFARYNYSSPIDSTASSALYQIHIQSYTSSLTKVSIANNQQTNSSYPRAEVLVNLWNNTSAITRIDIFMDNSAFFGSPSTFSLYGIARA